MSQEIELVTSFRRLTKNIILFFENNLFKDIDIGCSELNIVKTIKENTDLLLNVTEMSRILKMTKSAISQSISKLEKKGFIERRINISNKKMSYIVLTNKGNHIYELQNKRYLDSVNKVNEEMGKEDSEELSRLLEKLSNIINRLGGNKTC